MQNTINNMKKKSGFFLIAILSLLSLTFVSPEIYDNCDIYGICDIKWLSIDGSNANQDIDITPYSIIATYFIGDGSQLTNINTSSLNLSSVNYWTKTGNDLSYLLGNVGIGTATPTNALNVIGDGNFTENVTANWFNGLFNWTTGDDWNTFNGSTLLFNESKLASTTYNATSIVTVEGTLDAGNLASTNSIDNNWYNVSEDVGGSPLLIEINFTGVESFSNILLREQYTGGQGHEIEVQSWNYNTNSWEVHSGDITNQNSMVESVLFVLDSIDHIDSGLVQIRLDHLQNGISSHDFFLDYIALQEGFTSITTTTHDGLGGRNSVSNHPWALPTNGSRNMTENLTFEKDVIVLGTLYGGSPVKIGGGLNITSGNTYMVDNLSVEELIVRSGKSIHLAGADFSNKGYYTSVNTNWIIGLSRQPTAFLGVYANNESALTKANLVLETLGSAFNIIKNSPLHPYSANSTGLINEGDLGIFVNHDSEMTWWHYINLTKDEYGNIENLGERQLLMTLNDDGLNLSAGDFVGSGLMTPNMSGGYGIGVDTLSLIGGSKTTHYGGIGGGGGKISLQGGRGRDSANNPSSYAPILLQSNGGNVGIGTTSPDSVFHIKSNVPGMIGSSYAGQLIIQNPADDVTSNVVITGYESDGSGNPDQQLWYLGGASTSNEDITFLNRRNAKLTLGTSGTYHMTILGNGNVEFTKNVTAENIFITGNYIINGYTGFTGSCINASYVGGIVVGCND